MFAFLILYLKPAVGASYVQSYDHKDGLYQATITTMEQDDQGFLLLGTQDGLTLFDGLNFETFRYSASENNELASNRIKALKHGANDMMLVGTAKGLYHFDGLTKQISRIDHNFKKSVSSIVFDGNGQIWIGTARNGLYKSSPPYELVEKISSKTSNVNSITHLAFDSNEVLWIGVKNEGLIKYTLKEENFTRYAHQGFNLKSKNLSSLYLSDDQRLWIGYSDSNGIDVIATDTGKPDLFIDKIIVNKLTTEKVYAIFQAKDKRLWFGSDSGGGVFRYDANTKEIKQYRGAISEQGSKHNEIRSIFQDRSGDIWIGTASGLSKISPDKENFGHLSYSPDHGGLDHSIVTAVFEDENQVLWVGTYGGGLHRYLDATGEFKRINSLSNEASPINSEFIISLNQAPLNMLWVGTTDGLYLLDTTTNQTVKYGSEALFFKNRINDIRLDSQSRAWIRTHNKVSIYHPDTGEFCDFDQKLGAVRFLFAHKESMWIVPQEMKNGFFSINYSSDNCMSMVVERVKIEGLDIFEPMLEDSFGNIWGSVAGGVVKIAASLESFVTFTEADGLPNSVIYGALQDRDGHIWFSTNNGLAKLNVENKTFYNYNRKDGLQSNEFNGEASLKRQNGELLFGGINGLNLFDPRNIKPNLIAPKVQLTYLTIFDNQEQSADLNLEVSKKNLTNGEFFKLNGQQYGFEIEFIGLHFLDPERNRYRYKLEGFDNNWTEVSAHKRYARYTNLSPGKYRFLVTASNADGIWAQTPVFVDIEIETPWFLTPWAYMAYAFSALLMIYLTIRWRTYELRRKNQLLEQTVDSRTADIQRQKQTIEQQVDDLKALDKAKEHFFENISHEFRTPLALTIGPLKRLYEQTEYSEIQQKLEIPIRQSSRLLRLINQFLEISRLSSGVVPLQTRHYHLSEQIRQIVRTFKDSLNEKILTLTLNLDDDIVLNYDASAMEKILVNLLSNAINYTDENGQIWLRTERNNDQAVLLIVKDTGIGISDAKQAHIFERFNVEHNNADFKHGLGVGLALVKELVELHGGSIVLKSELGKGSCFTIVFPGSIQDAEPSKFDELGDLSPAILENTLTKRKTASIDHETQIKEKHSKQWTILIIDDELDMRIYLRELLQDYNILLAKNGRQGLDIAVDQIPDLIISDVMMPEMDGIELAQALKEHRNTSHIPIILVTAKGGRDSKLEGLREGIDDYIVKPFDDDELCLRVKNLIIIRQELARNSGDTFGQTKRTVPLPPNEQQFIAELHTYFNKNYTQTELSVDQIAAAMALEKRQLQRKLKALLNTTPTEYLRSFRLQKAAEMLLQGKTVSFTYEHTGFTGMSHFSRCFKASYAVSPSQYFEHFHQATTPQNK